MKTTVIHHSADYDGIFCREIARKFLPPDTEFIGWDFPDKPLEASRFENAGRLYIMDLPVDRVFGVKFDSGLIIEGILPEDFYNRLIWIDHHKSSIQSHPEYIPGYRIDGVAACRLAWQWFNHAIHNGEIVPDLVHLLPEKEDFAYRSVNEPLAVRLAGEYDVWDHRDNDADVAFQFGLDATEFGLNFTQLLDVSMPAYANDIVRDGRVAMRCYAKRDADIIRTRSFITKFEGLTFLALNTARCNSNTFAVLDVPETGHDACMGFSFDGRMWNVSMYHAAHRKDLDLSAIAKRFGGGGHAGACGFRSKEFPLS